MVHEIPKEKGHLVFSSKKEYDTGNFSIVSQKEAKELLDFYGSKEEFQKECTEVISMIRSERGLVSLLEEDSLP